MLQDVLTKFVHRVWRSMLQRYLPNIAPAMQSGSLPGTGPDQVQLMVQARAEFCQSRHLSHACVFIDISNAYYRLFRPALIRDIHTDEDLAAFFDFMLCLQFRSKVLCKACSKWIPSKHYHGCP